ncbi:hypothetical protein ES708_30952 [subsurface metagenome]
MGAALRIILILVIAWYIVRFINRYITPVLFDMFKLKREDLDENVKDVITVGQLYEMSGGEGTQIIFT